MEVPRRFTLDENSTVGSSVEAIQPTKILKNNKFDNLVNCFSQ